MRRVVENMLYILYGVVAVVLISSGAIVAMSLLLEIVLRAGK